MANKEQEPSSSPNLPFDIVEVILSKISSVKSLLRFKTVCKSWNTVISDPVFVRNHLKNSPNNLFLSSNRDNTDKSGFFLFKLEGRKIQAEALLERPRGGTKILCECNGVLLLSNFWRYTKKYVLWNPSTQRQMHLECPYGYDDEFYVVNHGICYDPITDDLKVVLIAEWTYAVYSCNNSSWTEKKLLETVYNGNVCDGIFHDGAAYWVLGDDDDYNEKTAQIVCFDPRVDELKTLQKPEQLSYNDDDDDDDDSVFVLISVAFLRGKLYLYCITGDGDDEKNTKTKIWIKVKDSNWKELISFEYFWTRNWWRSELVCLVENKFVFRYGKRLYYYSPSEKAFERFETDMYSSGRELLPYRISLYFPTGAKTDVGFTA